MSKTFRQWFLFLSACAAAGLLGNALCASPGTAADGEHNQIRMTVDFTVLPPILPDGTVPAGPDAPEPDQSAATPAAEPAAPAAPEPAPAATATATEPAAPQPAPAPAPEKGALGTVASVTLDETPHGFTIKALADKPFNKVSSLTLDAPARLVIDLQGNWDYRGANVIRSTGAVKHIVIGEHPDHLRIVVYYNTPPAKQAKPQFKPSGNELMIQVPLP